MATPARGAGRSRKRPFDPLAASGKDVSPSAASWQPPAPHRRPWICATIAPVTAPFAQRPLHEVSSGEPLPLGATVREGGVNFSVFSKHATLIELLLFRHYTDASPYQIIALESDHHRTFNYWHAFVAGAREGQIYGFRAHGPFDPGRGHRFDPDKLLVDPYARGIVYDERQWSRSDATRPGDNTGSAMKSLVVDPERYDWGDTPRPSIAPGDRIIYELHVRGFTRHESSGVAQPGTFDGLIEKIPYLLDLGVTTVQLMPIFQFDELELVRRSPTTGKRLTNYWGYSPIGFFAPHRGFYTDDWTDMRYLTGFRDAVKALHDAGLEVFMDVVYNHSAEGDERGPTLSLRGLDNSVYYLLEPHDPARYMNYSGCGNTLNSNHPIVRRLILDSLRYWATTMRVDGFRFDLASIMARDELGRPMKEPPLVWEIEADPALLRTRLIAEAWDAGGLYQVGDFPGERWSEWNGRFRDDVRRFLRGDHGQAGALASRMLGSSDLYEDDRREPHQSVNFVTCHDGFTLNDLVSYERKHNLANGENNRDGTDANYSANYGVEGPTDDPAIEALRRRQIKNHLAVLFLAHGTPMLMAGDEFRRTQRGNNNAYCQDNAISWVDWGLLERHAEIHRFTKAMIAFRKAHPHLRRKRYARAPEHTNTRSPRRTTVTWHGREIGIADFGYFARHVAYTLAGSPDDTPLHVMINGDLEPVTFGVPLPPGRTRWRRAIDTSLPAPKDIVTNGQEPPHEGGTYTLPARALAVLIAR